MIANPPYMMDDAGRSYRHGGGLLGGEVSLDWASQALASLTPGGTLLLYTGAAIWTAVRLYHRPSPSWRARKELILPVVNSIRTSLAKSCRNPITLGSSASRSLGSNAEVLNRVGN